MTENRFRILRRAGWVCAVALAGWLLVALLHKLAATWVAHPPPAPANVDLTREIPRHEQGRTVLGRNWREVREGLPGRETQVYYETGRVSDGPAEVSHARHRIEGIPRS